MMKKMLTTMLLGICWIAVNPVIVFAGEIKVEFNASSEMKDILTANKGKRVILRLTSGNEIDGTVSQLSNSLVLISRVASLEYYDAAVSLDKITAVIVKVRDKQDK